MIPSDFFRPHAARIVREQNEQEAREAQERAEAEEEPRSPTLHIKIEVTATYKDIAPDVLRHLLEIKVREAVTHGMLRPDAGESLRDSHIEVSVVKGDPK
jgi:hypothetical protein